MRFKNFALSISILIYFSCVTIPDLPKNESPECLAHFFEARTKIKKIQHNQWQISAGISYISLSLAWAAGVDGFFPLVSLPYLIYIKNKEADEVFEDYKVNYCKKTAYNSN